jgi:hypothetical protein
MALSEFIEELLTEGKVEVTGKPVSPSAKDLHDTSTLLQLIHQQESIHLAGVPPPYNEAAAIWAAQYFYKCVHYTVWRDIGESAIKNGLQPFPEPYTAAAAWSADLVLRYLPRLTELARGLSPGDILLQEMKNTAGQWLLSSPGIKLDSSNPQRPLPAHEGLRQLYLDRIIKAKDKSKLTDQSVREGIRELTGEQLQLFWPGIEIN